MSELLRFLKLYKAHWFRLSLGALFTLLTLLATIGLLTLSGWFIAATAVAGLWITKSRDFNYMMPAGGVRFLSVARTVARWTDRVVSHDATFRLLATLRCWFYRKLGPLSPKQLSQFRDGDLLNRLVADVDALDHLYLRLLTPLTAGAVAILLTGLVLSLFSLSLALILSTTLLLILLVFPFAFYILGKKPGEQVTQSTATLRQGIIDYVDTQQELAVFGGVKPHLAKLERQENDLLAGQRKLNRYTALSQALVSLFAGWLLVLIVFVGADILLTGGQPNALLALFAFATLAAFETVAPIADSFLHLGQTLASARRVGPILDMAPDIHFGEQQAENEFTGLTISGLSFHHPGSSQLTINGLNLTITPGEKVALLGATGCGKSTLLDLIVRQLIPQKGTISLNDQAIQSYSEASLRQQVCLISQRVHIFNDTLADNLRIAAPDANDAELCQALTQAGLESLIETDGLTQWLGEGGRQLSGGEARRLGLARALLHPAPLLLLDEPTEGLDVDTEAQVLDALFQHGDKRTLLYITHRQAALPRMDRVLLMENGQVKPAQP